MELQSLYPMECRIWFCLGDGACAHEKKIAVAGRVKLVAPHVIALATFLRFWRLHVGSAMCWIAKRQQPADRRPCWLACVCCCCTAMDDGGLQSRSLAVVVGYAIRPAKQHLRSNGDSETAPVLYMLISLRRLPIEAQVKPTS